MFLKEFLYFPKSDRKAIIFMLIVAVVALVGICVLGSKDEVSETDERLTSTESDSNHDKAMTRQGYENATSERGAEPYYSGERQQAERFAFDPNTADSTELLRLGLSPWQVRNIYKYRSKGGIYRTPSDFAQLYGLTVKQYRELEPYIRISSDYREASSVIHRERIAPHRDTLLLPSKIKPGEHINLNTADTTQLKKVPGVGSYFARAIANYRQRLGGFVSTEQLLEIEGFPEESLPYFVIGIPQIATIKVNRLTLSQLRRHPYINFYQARAITDFRRLKHDLSNIEELRQMPVFSEKDITRLRPYLEF